jgi:hypothetical protein
MYCTILSNLSGHVTCDRPAMTCPKYRTILDSFGPQAAKFYYIRHMITKWIHHLTKITVTTVTFQRFGGPRDM